jgi:Ca2+-binding EF-hand superfamily protein
MRNLYAAAFAALALVLAAPATADDVESLVAQRFAELDRDGDGVLSRLECSRMPGLLESFLKHDADKDGKLNRDEFARAATPLLLASYRR